MEVRFGAASIMMTKSCGCFSDDDEINSQSTALLKNLNTRCEPIFHPKQVCMIN